MKERKYQHKKHLTNLEKIHRRHEQFISEHHHHYHHGHTSGHGNSHGNYEHQVTVVHGYGGGGSGFTQTSSHNGGFGQLMTHNRGDHVPERKVTVKASGNNNAY
jgi:hypothetical protein